MATLGGAAWVAGVVTAVRARLREDMGTAADARALAGARGRTLGVRGKGTRGVRLRARTRLGTHHRADLATSPVRVRVGVRGTVGPKNLKSIIERVVPTRVMA